MNESSITATSRPQRLSPTRRIRRIYHPIYHPTSHPIYHPSRFLISRWNQNPTLGRARPLILPINKPNPNPTSGHARPLILTITRIRAITNLLTIRLLLLVHLRHPHLDKLKPNQLQLLVSSSPSLQAHLNSALNNRPTRDHLLKPTLTFVILNVQGGRKHYA